MTPDETARSIALACRLGAKRYGQVDGSKVWRRAPLETLQ
jgi:hypothetical protein